MNSNYVWVVLQTFQAADQPVQTTIVGVYSNSAAAKQVEAECRLDASRSQYPEAWSYRVSCEPLMLKA